MKEQTFFILYSISIIGLEYFDGYSIMDTGNHRVQEPLLSPEENRYVLYPIRRADIWKEYKKQLGSFWTAEELDFSQDLKDYETLNADEKHFIKYVLAFFAGSDGIVMDNLLQRFTSEVSWIEVKVAYGFQAMMEGIHSEVYSLMIDTFIKDEEEKNLLFNAITEIPCVSKKSSWALKWLGDRKSSFSTRLIAFACVEGIFFSGSFCAIFWLKQRGLMPGLTTSNEFISRDEGLHTDFACLLYKYIVNPVRKQKVYEIVKEAVDIEKEFICESLPCRLLGMNQEMMSSYIEFVADRLLVQLGYAKIYHTSNPFDFMERISLESRDSFFEKRVSNYSKSGVGVSKSEMTFGVDGEF
jgi:ribonucleotide reductase beta subunit family protein with ferritin-like domain